MKKLLLFICICLLATAKSHAQATPPGNQNELRKDSATDKIIFITLKIKKMADTFHVIMTNKKIVDGRAKPRQQNTSLLQEGDLICFIGDNEFAKTDTILISQPLTRRYEYPNENGVIGCKTVSLDETEITIRSPYKPSMKYLRIEVAKANKKAKPIATLSLN